MTQNAVNYLDSSPLLWYCWLERSCQLLRLFLKKVKHGKKCIVFHVLRIYAGKNRKTKNVGTCKPGASMFLRFSFFEIFFSKFVKCKKLYIFWHGLLKKRVNEWLGQWWLLLIFIPYSLTLSLTLSSALSLRIYMYDRTEK